MSKAFKEHDYIGLSEVSSIEQTSNKPKSIPIKTSNFSNKTIKDLNFKATELRLGLPGSESPVRVLLDDDISVNCPLGLVTNLVSGTKRGFSYAINGDYCNWVLPKNGECLKNCVSISSPVLENDDKLQSSPVSEQGMASHGLSKTQVVGWPPIRSFRRNSMAVNTTKTNNEKDFYLESGCLFIKVSMDGAPYLRKVDLKIYGSYMELSLALEKMFIGFTIGQHCDKEMPGQNKLTRGRLMDDHHPSEYFLTYEDKDGDWMLVGDVPWNMFMDSCRRLRIMKSAEAVGLASRAT